jgi:hypothetical protein
MWALVLGYLKVKDTYTGLEEESDDDDEDEDEDEDGDEEDKPPSDGSGDDGL